VAQAVVANAAAARVWLQQVAPLAQTDDLVTLPPEVRFDQSDVPPTVLPPAVPLKVLEVHDLSVVHDDGTVGVKGCDFRVEAGELVLVIGEVGSGKSSLLGALAGLYAHSGAMRWNDEAVGDPEVFLRPGQVAWVGQVPRVLSGSFADNVALGHGYDVDDAVAAACLAPDMTRAGGATALVGHRGVRLSGGQVQRLALARALAADTELVVADDVSSALDAETEVEVWASLRARGCAVVAASCKVAAVERADRVVVLESGRQVATGTWPELRARYGDLVA
jgi:ATP-binding cassette, subfamily B, bacterial